MGRHATQGISTLRSRSKGIQLFFLALLFSIFGTVRTCLGAETYFHSIIWTLDFTIMLFFAIINTFTSKFFAFFFAQQNGRKIFLVVLTFQAVAIVEFNNTDPSSNGGKI